MKEKFYTRLTKIKLKTKVWSLILLWLLITINKPIYNFYSVEHGEYCDLMDSQTDYFIKECPNIATHFTNELYAIFISTFAFIEVSLLLGGFLFFFMWITFEGIEKFNKWLDKIDIKNEK